jgi:glycosyltransferase involved in cell wall biosynthesis
MLPDVSVIIASYNHQPYVAAALTSVAQQSHTSWELIIVDDASTDGTPEAIAEWIVEHKTKQPNLAITPIYNTVNQGQYATVEQALTHAKGRYLAILNSDDMFAPDKLAKQVHYLDHHPAIAAVFTHVGLIDQHGQAIDTHRYYDVFNTPHELQNGLQNTPQPPHQWLKQFFSHGNTLCHPSVLIRQAVQTSVGAYNPCMGNTADHEYWVRLALKGHAWHVMPEPLTWFRVLPGEGNMGGRKPASQRRHAWEREMILRQFLTLTNWQDVAAIFDLTDGPPKLAQSQWDIPYHIAQQALLVGKPVHQRFALSTLHSVMQNPQAAAYLTEQYGFGYPQLIRLTGELPWMPTNPAPKSRNFIKQLLGLR